MFNAPRLLLITGVCVLLYAYVAQVFEEQTQFFDEDDNTAPQSLGKIQALLKPIFRPWSRLNDDADEDDSLEDEDPLFRRLPRSSDPDAATVFDLTFRPGKHIDRKNRTQIGRENATLFMLIRNWEVQDALGSMRQIEDRFNKKYRYPWTFLNDVAFTEEFKSLTTGMASGKTEYGLIKEAHWSLPDFIDEDNMNAAFKRMDENEVIYGSSLSYRHMCRFNSGFFFREKILDKYDYYWRVEPNVKFFCDQNYDPFTFMRENNKIYGFVIAILEYENTIPTLWDTVSSFFEQNPHHIHKDNSFAFVTDKRLLRASDHPIDSNSSYNLCHFWSNFEIANLNFFRSQKYIDFFEHLDKSGGFFYERWGDAPIHTIAVSAMLNRSEVHHFSDIGYRHEPYFRCPKDDASFSSGRCVCPYQPAHDVDFLGYSCLPKWWQHAGRYFMFNYRVNGDD